MKTRFTALRALQGFLPARVEASRNASGGWTLIEFSVVLAMAAILLALALPSFSRMLAQRHLEGIAAQVHADLQVLRTEAVSRNTAVRMTFRSAGQGSCYVVHTGTADDCTCDSSGAPHCKDDASVIRSAGFETASPVQVQANVAS